MNGPYLLAPTKTGITVAWETEFPVEVNFWYGISDCLENKLDVRCEHGAPWKDNRNGICMYRAVLTGLEPNSPYSYKIELSTGETEAGTFKTLKHCPGVIRLYTLSDSHLFETRTEFATNILTDRPDFIIHSGDIPIGTGYQKEQFESFWFSRGLDFLKHIPVVYTNGNHDDGPYFDDYFIKAQRDTYNSSPDGLHCSFNYGNTHIVIVNSICWGLYEMNAVMSNLPVDKETMNTVKASINWLEQDLETDAARNAKWRIVVMHHPYTDHFTHKHVTHILENNGVNLVIAGHLHFYLKNTSINPDVGAKTLYITQGSAQDPAGELDLGTDDERILSDFPEVIAMGKAIYSTLDISEEALVFRAYGISQNGLEPKVIDETILTQQKPRLTFANITLVPCEEDVNTLSYSAEVTNEGSGLTQITVTILDNQIAKVINLFGVKGKERVVALNAGETKKISGTITLTSVGEHVVQFGDAYQRVYVPKNSQSFELSNMDIHTGQGFDSDVVFTELEVTNLLSTDQGIHLLFYVDGKIMTTQIVQLVACEKKTVCMAYRFTQGGTYQVRVGDLEEKSVLIEGTMQVTPIVKDMSGKGNHGIIRGKPRLFLLQDGSRSLALDNYGDYIEIPDHPSLHVRGGFTGIVRAKMNRLPSAAEKDHNPLMIKGPSPGWGVNYLLRMVVKKNGVAAWGTCHGITEYAWDGGKVPIGEWAQYTAAFDRLTGGTSYINNQKVAEIGGINPDADLRCWEGHPLFIGYSSIGHVIKEVKRAKYFTHFPGEISQVRFYASKLTSDENQCVGDHPAGIGSRVDDLLVWLNFEDIEEEGQHTTEWRRPAKFYPTYKSEKQLWEFRTLSSSTCIPGSSSITVTVEVSDDQETIKDSKYISLKGGVEHIDISDLSKAQYIRVVTRLRGEFGEYVTDIPELKQYLIQATLGGQSVQLSWGTRAAWEKGTLEGAIGFEPQNRTKVIEEYTDVIH